MYKLFLHRATIAALLMIGALTACKKQDVDPAKPAAELSSYVTGQYTLKQISANGQVHSASDEDLEGGVNISRISANSVSLELAINAASTGEAIMATSVSDISVTDAGNNEVNLIKGTSAIGKGGSSKLSINIKGGDGVAYVLIMTK